MERVRRQEREDEGEWQRSREVGQERRWGKENGDARRGGGRSVGMQGEEEEGVWDGGRRRKE
eukprot:738083-Hanusia_phi.AAC.1